MLVFRSLLVPLTATLGFLLSIGATFGATGMCARAPPFTAEVKAHAGGPPGPSVP